jgi:ABC-type transport system involved in multi-copper enzyme maturation permease subunit
MRLARLVARSLAHQRGLLAGMSVVLAGFQVLLVVIGANLQREGLFTQLSAIIPPSFQMAFGGSMIASFGGLVAFGFFHPVVVLALAVGCGYLAGELAGDVDEGLVDLIAARPVPRGLLVARSALAAALAAAAIVGLMLLANRAATLVFTPPGSPGPGAGPLTLLAANLLAVTWCCGAAALAAAAAARKRATAAGGAALIFISLYLLNFAATWWSPARPLARLAPFHYFDAMPILLGTHDPTRDILGLLAAAAVCVLAAGAAYRRRDL